MHEYRQPHIIEGFSCPKNVWGDKMDFKNELNEMFRGIGQEVLIKLMEERGITRERLAEFAGCDVKTIQRMRTTGTVRLKTVVQVCIALGLTLPEALSLASKFGVIDSPSQAQYFLEKYPGKNDMR